ncbi:MAG: DUF4965 domain-containing protein [Ruminococcaceae bacterium]|nr:DUF4965 domain-containing protein [Oscillospiraceae bacterium]
MKMRVPSIPLITVDPYFSVWTHDRLNDRFPTHWTGARNAMRGTVTVDGAHFRFLGRSDDAALEQVSLDMDVFSTTAVFRGAGIELTAVFSTPILVTDLYYASRPVSYLKLTAKSLDGKPHAVTAKVSCSEELVLNQAGEGRAWSETAAVDGAVAVRMGNGNQRPLWRSGDLIRIDWGYFYLAAKGEGAVGNEAFDDLYAVWAEVPVADEALFAFAFDDIDSIEYFKQPLKAYWKKDGKTIEQAIAEAFGDYNDILARCRAFGDAFVAEANEKGGEHYAELLTLAYRQVMAAHKLVLDEEGNVLYISKECNSNGCAATVDVTYPSAPMYLLYNPELLKGMLRPVFRYARTDEWTYDFAPHDVGQYPLVNGQVYGGNKLEYQMPVEECGNMIVLCAALAEAEDDVTFAKENMDLLEVWYRYLVKYGDDPENQLCTDDFAGHLAHNCNLSLKAIMGMAGYSRILARLGRETEAAEAMETAKKYAVSFLRRAENPDGSYRLAYDREGTFSLKYNAIWDKVWGTKLLPDSFFEAEIKRYRAEVMPYGVPLDSREKYTKSDWTVWAASLTGKKEDLAFFSERLWLAYHTMRTREAMTDWYFTDTSEMRSFRHRTVQGGLFIRLMFE